MHRRDVQIAWAFVVGLWLSIGFVAWGTWDLAPDGASRTLLLIGGVIVLAFNTQPFLPCCSTTGKIVTSSMG